MAVFPPIRDEQIMTFNVVVQSLEQDPNYFNDPKCPYSDNTKAFFRKIAGVGMGKAGNPFEGVRDEEYSRVLDEQIEQLIADMDQMANQLGVADHSERLQYFKTKTTLIEKLVTMKERIQNLKELNEFRSIILNFLDEVCEPDQITGLMKRLDGVFGVKKND